MSLWVDNLPHALIIQEQKALDGLETGEFIVFVVEQPIVEKYCYVNSEFYITFDFYNAGGQ